ncbi:hypothetical protein [uncultured Microscilla sp.]|uniref:hypothetical protein n=1 Tax=uncultured Microscilla sp. TaxID=432653 RepID=UPI002601E8CB|nr:hypothetical protein [uncultured Microscilla sp.]
MEEVYQKLIEVITDTVPVQSEMATVKAVDKEKLECTVVPITNEALEIGGVNLKAVIDETKNGLVQIPKVGSIVLISLIENTDGDHYVSMYSDIDEVQLVQNEEEILKIDNMGKVTFHQGENKGLIKIEALKTQLEKNTQAIQKILDLFANWTAAPNDGGAALKALSASLAGTQLGDFSDIENDKVKH